MFTQSCLHDLRSGLQAVGFDSNPVEQLPPSFTKRAELLFFLRRQSLGGRADGKSEVGKHGGVYFVRLSQSATSAGKVAHLASVDDGDGNIYSGKGRGNDRFHFPRWLREQRGRVEVPVRVLVEGATRAGRGQTACEPGCHERQSRSSLWRHQCR